jgi:hypothetical protein
MKQKDFALILIVVVVSAAFSLVLSNIFISSPKNRQEKVEVVGEISSVFPEVDKQFFNELSKNPTVIIQIGDNQNPQTPTQ